VEGGLQVESSDLIAYGLIPEFTGRFPVLVSLAALNEDQLVQVLMTQAPYQVPETKHV
jgi:ATP-dependent protease Clp ATPase subunit